MVSFPPGKVILTDFYYSSVEISGSSVDLFTFCFVLLFYFVFFACFVGFGGRGWLLLVFVNIFGLFTGWGFFPFVFCMVWFGFGVFFWVFFSVWLVVFLFVFVWGLLLSLILVGWLVGFGFWFCLFA